MCKAKLNQKVKIVKIKIYKQLHWNKVTDFVLVIYIDNNGVGAVYLNIFTLIKYLYALNVISINVIKKHF